MRVSFAVISLVAVVVLVAMAKAEDNISSNQGQELRAQDQKVLHRSKRTIKEIMSMFRHMMRNMFGGGKKRGKKRGRGRGRGRPSYGPPNRPQAGYGAPRPQAGYGAPAPGYNAPQQGGGAGYGGGQGIGGGGGGFGGGAGGNIDSYGSPQAAPLGGGGGSIDSYGSPQAAPIGGGGQAQYGGGFAPSPSGNVAFPSSSSSSSFSQSLSNQVIKMLPAPNLATAAPANFGGSSVPAQSNYGSSNNGISFGSSSSSGFNSPSSVTSGFVPNNSPFSGGSVVSSGSASSAPDSYGIPQGNVISGNSGSFGVANNPFQSSTSNNQASGFSFGSTSSVSGSSGSSSSSSSFGSGVASSAPDSYGIPQGSVISNNNVQQSTAPAVNPFNFGSNVATNSNNNNNNNAIASIFGSNVVTNTNTNNNNNNAIASVFGSGAVTNTNNNNNNNAIASVFGSGVVSGNASPAPDSYGIPQANPVDTGINIRTNDNGDNTVVNQNPGAPTSLTDIFGSPVAPVGTSAPVPDDVINEVAPTADANDANDAPVGVVVRTEVEGEDQTRPPIEVDLVNGGTVDLTNGLNDNVGSTVPDVDLTGTTTAVPELFPGYEDVEYDPTEYDDYEGDEQEVNNILGTLQGVNNRASPNLPGYGNPGQGTEAPYSAGEKASINIRQGKEVRNGLFDPAEYDDDNSLDDEPFNEYTELDSEGLSPEEEARFVKVPLKIEELKDDSVDGDTTVILVGTPEEEEETSVETTTTASSQGRGGRGRTRGRQAKVNKKRVEDIPHEAFHRFLVEPPQAKQQSNQKKRGATDWSSRLRERNRQRVWRQFGLN